MLDGVRQLKGFRDTSEGVGREVTMGKEKWKALLGPPGSHRMLYTLQIVDGVLDVVESCDGGGEMKGEIMETCREGEVSV